MSATVLIVPGYGNSGPQHWQTLWEASSPQFRRVQQRHWEQPTREEWCAVLDAAVESSGECFIVAHSLGSLTLAHWASRTPRPIRGALLVAVPDPAGPNFPSDARGFAPLPSARFPFPSIVVASSSDPYDPHHVALQLAPQWGSRLVQIGDAGHINSASGLGDWPQGKVLLNDLMAEN